MTLTALTSEHGLTHLATLADVLKGCTDVQRGDGKRGIESIKKRTRGSAKHRFRACTSLVSRRAGGGIKIDRSLR